MKQSSPLRSTLNSPRHPRAGRFLRELRQAAGLSTTDVGLRLGWSRTEIAFLETGRRRLSIRHLVAVLGVLCDDPVELAGNFTEALRLLCVDEGVPPASLNHIFGQREE